MPAESHIHITSVSWPSIAAPQMHYRLAFECRKGCTCTIDKFRTWLGSIESTSFHLGSTSVWLKSSGNICRHSASMLPANSASFGWTFVDSCQPLMPCWSAAMEGCRAPLLSCHPMDPLGPSRVAWHSASQSKNVAIASLETPSGSSIPSAVHQMILCLRSVVVTSPPLTHERTLMAPAPPYAHATTATRDL